MTSPMLLEGWAENLNIGTVLFYNTARFEKIAADGNTMTLCSLEPYYHHNYPEGVLVRVRFANLRVPVQYEYHSPEEVQKPPEQRTP